MRPPQPPEEEYAEPIEPDLEPDYESGGWAVAQIPGAAEAKAKQAEAQQTTAAAPTRAPLVIDTTAPPAVPAGRPAPQRDPNEKQRYGESVVREVLGASFIEEQPHTPRVIPRGE